MGCKHGENWLFSIREKALGVGPYLAHPLVAGDGMKGERGRGKGERGSTFEIMQNLESHNELPCQIQNFSLLSGRGLVAICEYLGYLIPDSEHPQQMARLRKYGH